MDNRARLIAVLVLSLVGAAISWTLLQQHHGEAWGSAAISAVCGAGESGCDVVNRSSWSSLGGVPVAAIGMVFYLSLAALSLLAWLSSRATAAAAVKWALLLVGAAIFVDGLLLAVQVVSLKAFCKACLATYAVNIVIFLVLRFMGKGKSKEEEAIETATSDSRLFIGGWAAATLLAASFAWATESRLQDRQAQRERGVLGDSSAASASAAAREPIGNDVDTLRAEVARLRGALDDPDKRQRYDTDKAVGEYERAPVQSLDLSAAPFEGPAEAPITVVAYSDFLCPFCQSIASAFQQYIASEGRGRVKIYYKHFPLDMECNKSMKQTVHGGACRLALGGVCANEQGKFWPYHNRVFANARQLNNPQVADVVRLAGQAGLDTAKMQACLASPAAAQRLQVDVGEGERIGVSATPTLLINGKKMTRVNDFLEIVNREAKRLGLGEPPPPMLARPTPATH